LVECNEDFYPEVDKMSKIKTVTIENGSENTYYIEDKLEKNHDYKTNPRIISGIFTIHTLFSSKK